jgi:hypothetical protein
VITIRTLKLLIANLDDDTPILVPAADHSYREPRAEVTTVAQEGRHQWGETWPESTDPQVTALIIG